SMARMRSDARSRAGVSGAERWPLRSTLESAQTWTASGVAGSPSPHPCPRTRRAPAGPAPPARGNAGSPRPWDSGMYFRCRSGVFGTWAPLQAERDEAFEGSSLGAGVRSVKYAFRSRDTEQDRTLPEHQDSIG